MGKAQEYIDRMIADPDKVREELYAKLIEENGQEWFDANKKFLDNDWEAGCRADGFEPSKRENWKDE